MKCAAKTWVHRTDTDEHKWVAASVESIIARGMEISSDIKFELKTFKNTSEQGGVLDAIAQFGLRAPAQLSCERIRRRLDGRKILCVSMDGRTSILDSLKRAGFPDEAITSCFEEERIAGGKNSNLIEWMISMSNKYRLCFTRGKACGQAHQPLNAVSKNAAKLRLLPRWWHYSGNG